MLNLNSEELEDFEGSLFWVLYVLTDVQEIVLTKSPREANRRIDEAKYVLFKLVERLKEKKDP